ncbi:endo-1,4-beta-xylanase [Novosphingobium sp. BL-8A]|uniref:endo-1,4-beta-xylanase n=1 Tax=Novosphingobium sp. BL-8A TaxID=3127639 RepID=UPI00375685C2
MIDRRTMLSAAAIGGAMALPIVPSRALPPHALAAEAERPLGLDGIARKRCLRFGTAVMAGYLEEPDYQHLLMRDCSVITPESDFKWKWLESKRGIYDYRQARRINAFADTHGMTIRGNTFVWNDDERLPAWIVAMEEDLRPAGGRKLVGLMRRHAHFLAKAFPHVNSWDCVSQALRPQDGTLADSVFTRILGEAFLDIAFGLVNECMPWAKSVYNAGVSWEKDPRHRSGVLRLLDGALSRGVRIDALGIQSHLGETLGRPHDEPGWHAFLQEIRGMGLEVLITELDCSDRLIASDDPATRDAQVAAHVKGYLDLTLDFTNVRTVVTRALTDRHSDMNRAAYPAESRRTDGLQIRGAPYGEDLRAKPMYDAIASALEHAPRR